MFCVSCGSKLEEGARFCNKCGMPVTPVKSVYFSSDEAINEPVNNVPADNQANMYSQPVHSMDALNYDENTTIEPKKSKKGLIILISSIAAVVVICAVLCIIFLGGGKDSKKENTSGGENLFYKNDDVAHIIDAIQYSASVAADVEYECDAGDKFIITIRNGVARLSYEGRDSLAVTEEWSNASGFKNEKHVFMSNAFESVKNVYTGVVQTNGSVIWYYDSEDEIMNYNEELLKRFEGEYDQYASTISPTKEPVKPEPTKVVEPTVTPTPTEIPSVEMEGKVLNIYCWNDEFAQRLKLYPEYEPSDENNPLAGGYIGDVKVNFVYINNYEGEGYQGALDNALANNEYASSAEKVDIFLAEADYINKYIDNDLALNIMDDLNISSNDLAQQYEYTLEVGTASNGELKALSWQACPGVLFYNRDIALEVLGTEDPAKVQKAVADWKSFYATAKKVKAKGYNMTASVNETYRVYANNVTNPWVSGGTISLDANIQKWAKETKSLFDMGATANIELWSGYEDAKVGKCFCTFGPAWLINYCFGYDLDYSGSADMSIVANAGRWGACQGPQSFFWGGTWMLAAKETDNQELVADIFKALTCDEGIMLDIVMCYDDFANNKNTMKRISESDYSSYILGGQNPISVYDSCARNIHAAYITMYDMVINETLQNLSMQYFDGGATFESCVNELKDRMYYQYGLNY